jgi:hypothetical protein
MDATKNKYVCKTCLTDGGGYLWVDVHDMYGDEGKWCTKCALLVDNRAALYSTVPKLNAHPAWLRPLPRELTEEAELRDSKWFDEVNDRWTSHIVETLKQPGFENVIVDKIGRC